MVRTSALILPPLAILGGLGCSGSAEPATGPDGPSRADAGAPDLPQGGGEECAGIACLPCSRGIGCASEGESIPGTCCAIGESLVHLGEGSGSEVVDIEVDGTFAYLCGGFGLSLSRIGDPGRPVFVGDAAERCQRIGIGPVLPDGSRVFYLAHHGDSWVRAPFLATYTIDGAGSIRMRASLSEPGVLYEGLAWRDGFLYVAAHAGGVRVYGTDASGVPSLLGVVDGFTNAWKVALGNRHDAYVADAEGGLRVLSLDRPDSPVLIQSVATTAPVRDVDTAGDRVYAALGGAGLDVFDASRPGELVLDRHLAVLGSVQAVSAGSDAVALAAWSHVELRDARSLALLGAARTRSAFEQDLGVAFDGSTLFAGEWEGLHTFAYRPGRAAPIAWIDDEHITFSADREDARAVIVRNLGPLELVVRSIAPTASSLSVDRTTLAVAPGAAGSFEVTYRPPPPLPAARPAVDIETNEPGTRSRRELPVVIGKSGRIDVGESLDGGFGFLDPTGSGQLGNLKGHVIVLVYFALF